LTASDTTAFTASNYVLFYDIGSVLYGIIWFVFLDSRAGDSISSGWIL